MTVLRKFNIQSADNLGALKRLYSDNKKDVRRILGELYTPLFVGSNQRV